MLIPAKGMLIPIQEVLIPAQGMLIPTQTPQPSAGTGWDHHDGGGNSLWGRRGTPKTNPSWDEEAAPAPRGKEMPLPPGH